MLCPHALLCLTKLCLNLERGPENCHTRAAARCVMANALPHPGLDLGKAVLCWPRNKRWLSQRCVPLAA